jgi:hypothetical protein
MKTRMKLLSMNNAPLIIVQQQDDGTFVLEWDENDPRCEEFKDWAEADWIEAIENGLAKF